MLHKLKAVFKSLEDHDVHYLIIGGIAAILYGVPRPTFNVDLLIEPTPENAGLLLKALFKAGLATAEMTDVETLLKNEISVFDDFVRVDVQTSKPGIKFAEAWPNREIMSFDEQSFIVASKKDVIASKRAAGRSVDLEDVRMLEAEEE